MTQEEFFEHENARNIERDKAYKAHLKEIVKLQERQVLAQEGLVVMIKDMATAQSSNTSCLCNKENTCGFHLMEERE